MFELFFELHDFLNTGGPVLWGILLLTIVLWAFILERYWFIHRVYPKRLGLLLTAWNDRDDKCSWFARKIRQMIISKAEGELHQSLSVIKILISLGPLFGLLGTVTGMIEVFDTMALANENDARMMASGISKAIITTMAGLLVALTGLYPAMQLTQRARRAMGHLSDALKYGM